MGQLISLAERAADRSRPGDVAQSAFFFDLACPFSYMAAERVERELGDIDWIPVASLEIRCAGYELDAEREAAALRLPLVWPEHVAAGYPRAARAAAFACEQGRGPQFALAASRLAFCGGFDIDDPDILAEAGSAAGLVPDDCLAAAIDRDRDVQLRATAAGLHRRGVDLLPAVRIGPYWRHGVDAVEDAATLVVATAADARALGRG
jgi:2-hydroxychromene-2-carboxylate isomerase